VADFFYADGDDLTSARDEAERELDAAKAVAALAVAQAHRSEIELRGLLKGETADPARLAALVTRLEEERQRARSLVKRCHDTRRRTVENLTRSGQIRLATELNSERAELRELVARAQAAVDEQQTERLELELRAQAAGLDVLEALERGATGAEIADRPRAKTEDVQERARSLLAEDAYRDLLGSE